MVHEGAQIIFTHGKYNAMVWLGSQVPYKHEIVCGVAGLVFWYRHPANHRFDSLIFSNI